MWPRQKIFCSKPFEWFEITQLNDRGGVYLCCPSWLNTCIGNIRHASVEEIWNGQKARAIRRSILNGSFQFCDVEKCAFLQTRFGPVQKIKAVTDPPISGGDQKRLNPAPLRSPKNHLYLRSVLQPDVPHLSQPHDRGNGQPAGNSGDRKENPETGPWTGRIALYQRFGRSFRQPLFQKMAAIHGPSRNAESEGYLSAYQRSAVDPAHVGYIAEGYSIAHHRR